MPFCRGQGAAKLYLRQAYFDRILDFKFIVSNFATLFQDSCTDRSLNIGSVILKEIITYGHQILGISVL